MKTNPIKIISIVVIILSLLIISVIVYQQRSTIVANTLQTGKNIVNLFPLGTANKKPIWNSTGSSTDSTLAGGGESSVPKIEFEKITDNPVASADVIDLPGASSTLIYVEKATGNIFQIKNSGQAERISNLTIPEVFDAYFGLDKSKNIRVVVRSVVNDQLQAVILNLNNTTAFGTSSDTSLNITKKPLASNIKSIAISPKKDQLLFVEDLGSRAVAYITDWDLKNKKIVTVLPFKDWIISWPNKDIVVFQTKASSDVSGSVYYLNLKDGSFKRIGNNILGLTTKVSPDTKNAIYSSSIGQTFNLAVRNIITNKAVNYSPKTLPEKCQWFSNSTAFVCAVPSSLPLSAYPDDWYQGNISFEDSIWLYYTANAQSTLLHSPEIVTTGLDLLPQATDDFYNFYFIDKKTFKLYRLNGDAVFDPGA